MLLRFRVANVRSLRDVQELSFVVPDETEGAEAARQVELSDGTAVEVYPLLGIFGANASGKSNIVAAMKSMRNAVLNSYAQWTGYQGIPREPFKLDPKYAAEDSSFEVSFVLEDGVRWTYGFDLGATRVEAEWLYAYPNGRRQVWLDRDASRSADPIRFPGDRVRSQARLIDTTRPNALLISRAATDNHPQLTPIHQWFVDNLWDITPETERRQREAFTARSLLDPEAREHIEDLLRVADLGIKGTEVEQLTGGRLTVRFLHSAEDAPPTALDWEAESLGTRSWFALLGPLLHALDQGAVLLIDELDSSLHPRFAAEVVRLFESPQANSKGAQLVFTAHDPSLIRGKGDARLLEPGQIWLSEKDASGATQIYPISDLDPTDEEDLMASYLRGSFGGVPRVTAGQVARRLEYARTVGAKAGAE